MFLSKQEKGQGLIEYALIIVLVSIVVIVVLASSRSSIPSKPDPSKKWRNL
jgi:Flp pilus assembly pilin Flp